MQNATAECTNCTIITNHFIWQNAWTFGCKIFHDKYEQLGIKEIAFASKFTQRDLKTGFLTGMMAICNELLFRAFPPCLILSGICLYAVKLKSGTLDLKTSILSS